jgi:hypothetical protein
MAREVSLVINVELLLEGGKRTQEKRDWQHYTQFNENKNVYSKRLQCIALEHQKLMKNKAII